MCFPIVPIISCIVDFFFDEEEIINDEKCDYDSLEMERGEEVKSDDDATIVTMDTTTTVEEEEEEEEREEEEPVMIIPAAQKLLAVRNRLRELELRRELQKNKIHREQLSNNRKSYECGKTNGFSTPKSAREKKRELEKKYGSLSKK